MRCTSGQMDGKDAALPRIAVDMDFAPQDPGNDVVYDVQAQTTAAVVKSRGEEWVEYSGQIPWADAGSIIPAQNNDMLIVIRCHFQRDTPLFAIFKGVQQGVVDQVGNDLPQWPGIAVELDARGNEIVDMGTGFLEGRR